METQNLGNALALGALGALPAMAALIKHSLRVLHYHAPSTTNLLTCSLMASEGSRLGLLG